MDHYYGTNHSHSLKGKIPLQYSIGCFYLYFLLISPLLYLTGSAEFVTPLVLSNFISMPSLSGINYIVMLVAISTSINIKNTKALLIFLGMLFLFLFLSFRNINDIGFIYSLLSQIIIISPAFVFITNRKELSFIDGKFIRKILVTYVFYCLLSIIIHYVILAYATSAGIHFPNERMVGIFKNPNHMAAFAILTLILFYYDEHIRSRRSHFFGSVFVEVISILCVYLSGSRSALILLVMIVFYQWFFLLKSRRRFLFVIISFSAGVLYIIYNSPSISELIAIFSKRDVSDLESAGNMRITILFDMLKEFSTVSLISGEGSGEGTAIFIKLQSILGYKVTWLDSNVNAIIYTYGLLFFVLMYITMIIITMHSLYFKEIKAMIYLYICWFFWFFNVAEYFPILFIALIVTARSTLDSNRRFTSPDALNI